MDNQQFEITKKWLLANRTAKGSWTKAQIVALGVSYPPIGGWLNEAVGRLISASDANDFESGKNKFSVIKGMKVTKIIASLPGLDKDRLLIIRAEINRILGAEHVK